MTEEQLGGGLPSKQESPNGGRSGNGRTAKSLRLAAVEGHLWPGTQRRGMWMIVDCARDRRIFGMVLDCFYSSHSCLFSGSLDPAIQVVAPYLLELEHDDARTRRFISEAWGNSWGVFLRCDTTSDKLRKHLRRFLTVKDPKGQRMLFRYYDPRVLRVYLPTCNQIELTTVFGPVEEFLMEGEDPETVCRFRFGGRGLIADRVALNGIATAQR
jgi:hypothetical protein